MTKRLAQIGLIILIALIAVAFAVQMPALAQKGQPPTPVPPKGVTPTPPAKQPAISSDQESSAPTFIGLPNYNGSSYQARGAHPGETITYQLVISNSGSNPGAATIARIYPPVNATYVGGSAQAQGRGSISVNPSLIEWSGVVTNGKSVTITYRSVLPNSIGTLVQSYASIYDPGLVASVNLNNQLTTQAKTGGPDGFGYTYKDSFAVGGPAFSWIPTTTNSVKLNFGAPPNDDMVTGTIPLSFTFKFYTGTYTNAYINTNGLVMFGVANASNTDNNPKPIPTIGYTDNYLTCFGADLYVQDPSQGIWYETYGSAPNRLTVITFREGYFPTANTDFRPGLWQVILYETSNHVKCQYQETAGPIFGSGSESVIGLENYNGTAGIQYFYDYKFNGKTIGPLEDRLAIEFTPGPASLPVYVASKKTASYNVHPGDIATFTLLVSNTGTANGTATQVTDPIPVGTTYIGGSAVAHGGGSLTANASQVSWSGSVLAGQAISITYRVQLPASIGTVINNAATITDPQAASSVVITDSSLKVQPNPIGGPDLFGYTYKDSYAPGGPAYSWVATTSNSTLINFGAMNADDIVTGPIPISFTFNFYGNVYTQAYVSSNGLVSFGSGNPANINYPIPTADPPNNYASCFWSDLYIFGGRGEGVWYETFGSGPSRYTVLTFRTEYFATSSYTVTPDLFQMILYEGSNQIKCQYAQTAGPIDGTGGASTIGLENIDGTDGLQYFFHEYSYPIVGPLEPRLAILFTPGSPRPVFAGSIKTVSAGTHPGELFTYTLNIVNSGSASASAATMHDPIPSGAAYAGLASFSGGGSLNANSSFVDWSGALGVNQRVTITYRALWTALSGIVTNTMTLNDPLATRAVLRSAATKIQPYSGVGTGPGTPVYIYHDSYDPSGVVTYSWVFTGGASTKLSLLPDADNGYAVVPIGFTFRFDGRNFTNAFVSANGLVMFNTDIGSSSFTNEPIPTPGNVDSYATCFWTDQVATNAGQGIWYQTFGLAPNRYTVITFLLDDNIGAPTKPYRYQMILYEGSNRIKCQYSDMSGSSNGDGRTAAIGLENKWGDSGVEYFFNVGDLPYGPIENGLAITFEPARSLYLPLVLKNF